MTKPNRVKEPTFSMRNIEKDEVVELAKQQDNVFMQIAAELDCDVILFDEVTSS